MIAGGHDPRRDSRLRSADLAALGELNEAQRLAVEHGVGEPTGPARCW